jgi:hypothetical protein
MVRAAPTGLRSPLTEQEKAHMLSRCANSQCSKPFLRLREGKLFLVETDCVAKHSVVKPGEVGAPLYVRERQPQRQVEHYWLCDDCASRWTLIYDRDRGVTLAPLRRPAMGVANTDGVNRHRIA